MNPFANYQRRAEAPAGHIAILATSADMSRGQEFLFSDAGKLVKTTDRVGVEAMNAVRAAAGFAPIKHYQMEFEDFDPADMPELPPGFEDHSWHNDSCPSFENSERGLQLWVDYADAELREFPEGDRFCVYFMTGVGYGERLSDEPGFVSNEWAEVEKWLAEEADEARRVMLASDDERLADIVSARAVEFIAGAVQEALKVGSGDVAGMFFDDGGDATQGPRGIIREIVVGYLATERTFAEEGEEA